MINIVLGHRAERDGLLKEGYVLREGLEQARQSLRNKLIKVIIGPRRAGKSVFAIQMLKGKNFAYLNFDDERLVGFSDYDDLVKAIVQVYGKTEYLLFDEIQNLPNWELFVNRLQRKGYNLIITGSNSRLLSRELATHLTGRFIEFRIFPFSFNEFLRAKGFEVNENIELKETQGVLLNLLNEYLTTGGYPEVVLGEIDERGYLSTLFESILFKDIVKRYNIRYAKRLYELGCYLITNHSGEFTYNRLKNILSFNSVHTVENYINYLTEAFLIFTLSRFSSKLKEQLKSPRKVYAYDLGMIDAIKFRTSPDTGKLMESLTAIELLRRGKEIYYYRTTDGKEVDFAVKMEVAGFI